jgi:dihydroflavonol-4-reductase
MTTLVTGATGFVGSHIVQQLLARGEAVRVLVRPGRPLGPIEGLDVEVVRGDVRDRLAVCRAVRGARRIFHAAADYRLWARNPDDIYETNLLGTRNMLASIDCGVERFVYTSTVATITTPRDPWPDETVETSLDEMIGDYKRSKWMAERAALKAAKEGAPVVIVNPTTPIGPGDWHPTPTGQIIVDFLCGRIPAYVNTGLNLVPVEDVARGHLLAADYGSVGERYLLGGRNVTFKAMLEALAAVSGHQAPHIRLPWSAAMAVAGTDQIVARLRGREPHIPIDSVRMARHFMWANCMKAQLELGFVPGPIDAALSRAVEWYREQRYVPDATGQKRGNGLCWS